VLGSLGRGGLGSVYEAYDPQLDRKIAIKVLHDRSGDDRLLREARALARLTHTNVVTVHDIGVAENGAVFVAMELVRGVTLGAWLAEQHRSWTEVRDAFEQAGRGLLAAHQAGLVHRDFKPSNVIIGEGHVRVLDFGLARTSEAQDESGARPRDLLAQTVTAAGTWLGTPAYVSPEQIAGDGVGPHSDQFSFCVALHEGLYGVRPFIGDDVEQTLAAIERCEPPAPPTGSRVPAWLHAVVLRGLSRAPADRWPSMADLLDALVRDRRSRRRQRIGLALAVVLAAVLGAGVVLAMQPDPEPAEVALVDRITDEARAAAAQSWFVYPPVDDPDLPTAYRKVLELEAQSGAVELLASARASELRTEFATTLARLGDDYWDREGGAAFASDYYAAALVFDPEHEHARARTTLTPGEVRMLGDKAADGSFSPAELVAGESLAVLAEDDPDRRAARARKLFARRQGPAASSDARLHALVDVEAPPSEIEAPPVRMETPPRIDPPPSATKVEPTPTAKAEPTRGDAEALAASAHQAFEAARYHEAIRLAKRAVAIAPRRGAYWQLLGDANFRVLAYDEARKAYRRAADLGQASARKRLELVEARAGASR
jgi:tRNA A-37 threonylcarbamoyl transferase component Bud32/tetratricopeptide (TPR) repeat protein